MRNRRTHKTFIAFKSDINSTIWHSHLGDAAATVAGAVIEEGFVELRVEAQEELAVAEVRFACSIQA